MFPFAMFGNLLPLANQQRLLYFGLRYDFYNIFNITNYCYRPLIKFFFFTYYSIYHKFAKMTLHHHINLHKPRKLMFGNMKILFSNLQQKCHKLHDLATDPIHICLPKRLYYLRYWCVYIIISISCVLSVIVLMIFTFQIINNYNLYNSIGQAYILL